MTASTETSPLKDSPLIPERVFGIIGHPLGHTMSPLLHNWGFTRMGIKASYVAFPTPPERLEAIIQAVRTLPVSGLSVTIPHKEAVIPLLDSVSPLATQTGAVNTLVWEDHALVGHNTDVAGFVSPLLEREHIPASALVLGAGGAAKAVLAGLFDIGVRNVTVANRNVERATALAAQFGAHAVGWERRHGVEAHLVVNTTPMGMAGKAQADSPLPQEYWTPGHLAYDLVYNPRETVFLRQARIAGAVTIDGLSMFAAQGAAQFKLWTGLDLPMREVKELLASALGV
ncbi:MAG: shikimate dehydrogenase [Desulfovibrio sp.]|nr:shikimate dehydrogenase [Desulfovibrio sp.]MBI4960858.1 shikimate dehydrogenase [Desulfovibrio sp.]